MGLMNDHNYNIIHIILISFPFVFFRMSLNDDLISMIRPLLMETEKKIEPKQPEKINKNIEKKPTPAKKKPKLQETPKKKKKKKKKTPKTPKKKKKKKKKK